MMNLYREKLMEHYRHPRNHGRLHEPDFTSGEYNPSCGDSITFDGRIADGFLTEVSFVGKGCVISQAAASMLTELSKAKKLDAILAMNKVTMLKLIGMDLGPTRLKCALLPLEALQTGIKNYKKGSHARSHQTTQSN